MNPNLQREFDKRKNAPLTWDPVKGGKRAWICFEDEKTADLGEDPDGSRFERICERMLNGNYYPPDAVRYINEKIERGEHLSPGDRVLQRAPLFPSLPQLGFWSMVEIFAAESSEDRCTLGYVTTAMHHGKGIWQATLAKSGTKLSLHVKSTASPHSWLFWLGLPIARFLQLRARRRAIEEFRKL